MRLVKLHWETLEYIYDSLRCTFDPFALNDTDVRCSYFLGTEESDIQTTPSIAASECSADREPDSVLHAALLFIRFVPPGIKRSSDVFDRHERSLCNFSIALRVA